MLNKFFFILSIFLIHNVCAENITGKIISIADGDTATIINNNQQTKIRLAEIDTPEKNQPYGKKAKKGLWYNIAMKKKRGEKMRKKGAKGAPTAKAIKRSQG